MATDIYSRVPVNKLARVVTSQTDVTNDFLLKDKEHLKVLQNRKTKMTSIMVDLKKELGIDGRENFGQRTKYPRKILNNPKFRDFQTMRESLAKIDAEINEARARIPKEHGENFQHKFTEFVRVNYPEFYGKIKDEMKNMQEQK